MCCPFIMEVVTNSFHQTLVFAFNKCSANSRFTGFPPNSNTRNSSLGLKIRFEQHRCTNLLLFKSSRDPAPNQSCYSSRLVKVLRYHTGTSFEVKHTLLSIGVLTHSVQSPRDLTPTQLFRVHAKWKSYTRIQASGWDRRALRSTAIWVHEHIVIIVKLREFTSNQCVSRDLTPKGYCVLLPVTVLQYITSNNSNRHKSRKVLLAQHYASLT